MTRRGDRSRARTPGRVRRAATPPEREVRTTAGQSARRPPVLGSQVAGNAQQGRRLQSALGNRRVQRELALTRRSGVHRQRDDGNGLPLRDRLRLESETGDRMGIAFSKYGEACAEEAASIRAAAAAEAGFINLIVDIGLNVVPLGRLGKGLLLRAIDTLPAGAPEVVQGAAVVLLDNADSVVKPAIGLGKHALKKGIKQAVKKPKVEEFIDALAEQQSVMLERIRGRFSTMRDEELLVMCAAFSSERLTKAFYRTQIREVVGSFQEQVAPIGAPSGGRLRFACYIDGHPDSGDRTLAVVELDTGVGSGRFNFSTDPDRVPAGWEFRHISTVSDKMRPLARRETITLSRRLREPTTSVFSGLDPWIRRNGLPGLVHASQVDDLPLLPRLRARAR